jgi:phage terminase large subunit-like protein
MLKWKLFLPSGDMKKDPIYGWEETYKNGHVESIVFNSGVTIIFKTYEQKVVNIQTGTVYAIWLDEECPLSHWPEIQARVNATDGYISSVFTATIGQEYWRLTLEGKGEQELFPEADKWRVTLFDCLYYMDGTPSPWTFEKVKRAIARSCSDPSTQKQVMEFTELSPLKKFTLSLSDSEVQRRILGKFVLAGGRKYEAFRRERNMVPSHPIPSNWLYYGGVDYGSGGESGHPSAAIIVAVSPDFTTGRVIRARRPDGILTTAKDLLDIYRELRGDLVMMRQVYDYACKDFHTFATAAHESFEMAEKSHELGVPTINNLFKMGALSIFEDDPELEKLATELMTVQLSTPKNKAKDDLCDALRYVCMAIPWNWKVLDEKFRELEAPREPAKPEVLSEREQQRVEFLSSVMQGGSSDFSIDEHLSEWNSMLNEFDT